MTGSDEVEQQKEIDPVDFDVGSGGFGVFDMPHDMDYDMPSDGGIRSGSEDPEQMRAGSEDRNFSKESQGLLKGRRSLGEGVQMPDFEMISPSSPRGSSLVSGDKSRLASIGEVYDPLAVDFDVDTPFKSMSLKEEPESFPSQQQVPASQVRTRFTLVGVAVSLPMFLCRVMSV